MVHKTFLLMKVRAGLHAHLFMCETISVEDNIQVFYFKTGFILKQYEGWKSGTSCLPYMTESSGDQ